MPAKSFHRNARQRRAPRWHRVLGVVGQNEPSVMRRHLYMTAVVKQVGRPAGRSYGLVELLESCYASDIPAQPRNTRPNASGDPTTRLPMVASPSARSMTRSPPQCFDHLAGVVLGVQHSGKQADRDIGIADRFDQRHAFGGQLRCFGDAVVEVQRDYRSHHPMASDTLSPAAAVSSRRSSNPQSSTVPPIRQACRTAGCGGDAHRQPVRVVGRDRSATSARVASWSSPRRCRGRSSRRRRACAS